MSEGRLNLSFDAVHDAEAGVWAATSAEGRITTEAPSRDALVERLKVIVPDVLECRLGRAPRDVSITINWQELRTVEQTELSSRREIVWRHSANGVLKDAGLRKAF